MSGDVADSHPDGGVILGYALLMAAVVDLYECDGTVTSWEGATCESATCKVPISNGGVPGVRELTRLPLWL